MIAVNGKRIRVYCDMETDGGGWTVDFYRKWTEYERGFGDLTNEFWLGLDNIYRLTSTQSFTLRVDLEDFDGNTTYAEYRNFSISGPDDFYRLHISGYSGTAGDSLAYHNNRAFTTYDRDRDSYSDGSCAVQHHGAWWYKKCYHSNLNGRYKQSAETATDVYIYNFRRSCATRNVV
nr:hypothetical protein BaRGS_017647 [Batillaria attramentaria]